MPFGGVPVALMAQTQSGSPLAQIARLGGSLAVTGVVTAAGVSVAAALRRSWWPKAGIPAAVVLAATIAGLAVPPPDAGPPLSVALVQGGGPRGTRAVDTSTKVVFDAHLAAAAGVPSGTDLTLLPEDVVKTEADVVTTTRKERSWRTWPAPSIRPWSPGSCRT